MGRVLEEEGTASPGAGMILELHLTYRCNLACWYCNRGCRLWTGHTPDLSRERIRAIVKGAGEVEKFVLIGGEPTLHPRLQ
jgi:MoaA/NifB/PqqE/SkfB family radical SAM enzyme